MTERTARITAIARQHLNIASLETRRNDALDYHDLAVWRIKSALESAYDAGIAAASKPASV